MIGQFFASLTNRIFTGAIAILLVVVGLQAWQNSRLSDARDEALREVGRLEATIDQIEAAQEQARIAARNQRLQAEADYRQLAEEADARVEQARVDAMDAAERFIARNRVPRPAPDRGVGSGAGTSADSGSPASSNGPRAGAELDGTGVIVMADDVRICTENTLRLQEVRRWSLELAGGAE